MKPKLITTLAEIQAYLPVNMTSDFDVVSPFLAAAENMNVVKMISEEQFEAFVTAYTDASSAVTGITDEDMQAAVTSAQQIIACMGYYLAIPVISLSVGSSGIQITSNENTKNAFQWQVEDLKASVVQLGLNAVEDLLGIMEGAPTKFAPYLASPQRAMVQGMLIRTAADFSRWYEIGSSGYIFKTIAYAMKRIEDQSVNRIYGADFFKAIKANDDLSEKEQYLVDNFLKPGIALLTVAKAIVERVITFQDGSVGVNFRGRTDNMKESLAPTAQQIADLAAPLVTDGNTFLQDGSEYVLANLGDFPDYVQPQLRRGYKFKNRRGAGVFGV